MESPSTTHGSQSQGAKEATQSDSFDAARHGEALAAGCGSAELTPKHGWPRSFGRRIGHSRERAQGDNVDAERHGESPVARRGLSKLAPIPGSTTPSSGNSTEVSRTQLHPLGTCGEMGAAVHYQGGTCGGTLVTQRSLQRLGETTVVPQAEQHPLMRAKPNGSPRPFAIGRGPKDLDKAEEDDEDIMKTPLTLDSMSGPSTPIAKAL